MSDCCHFEEITALVKLKTLSERRIVHRTTLFQIMSRKYFCNPTNSSRNFLSRKLAVNNRRKCGRLLDLNKFGLRTIPRLDLETSVQSVYRSSEPINFELKSKAVSLEWTSSVSKNCNFLNKILFSYRWVMGSLCLKSSFFLLQTL